MIKENEMREKPEGYCHICGKYGKLSFEHIPPQKALNNNKAIVYTGENAIKRYKGENAKYKINNKVWVDLLYVIVAITIPELGMHQYITELQKKLLKACIRIKN